MEKTVYGLEGDLPPPQKKRHYSFVYNIINRE